MLRSVYTEGAWVTYPTRLRRGADPAASPRTVTVPDATSCTPTIERINVDFPQPLGPSNPVTTPDPMSSVSPSRTGLPPRTTVRSETAIAGPSEMPFTTRKTLM